MPFLGPGTAGLAGGLVGQFGLGGGFWTALVAALVGGFVPIVAYRLWKWAHHRRGP